MDTLITSYSCELKKKYTRCPRNTTVEIGAFSCSNKLGNSYNAADSTTPTSLSRHNGNRDNVPSLRPVTSANDIQIPLKRRDVRLTTFELQIAISLWLWTVDPSDSGTIDKDNSKNGRLSRVNTGTSIFHSQFKSPAQQVDCEIYEWCHCSISQMRHFDIYLDQRHDDIHLINIQLT